MENNNARELSRFLELLFLVFLVLKLTYWIDWSWWFVFAPLYAPLVVFAIACIMLGVVNLIIKVVKLFKK